MLRVVVLIMLWTCVSVELVCPRGRYGPECSGVCRCLEGSGVCRSVDGRCTDGLCRPGWANPPFCESECPASTFGLNCSFQCNCKVNDTCNKINGLCSSGQCHDRWTGPACQTVLPVMTEPPTVISLTSSDVTLSWPSWYSTQARQHVPLVIIEAYIVQSVLKTKTSSEWTDMGSVPANKMNPSFGPYIFTTRGLSSGSLYSFRVNVLWLNNNKVISSSPGPPTTWITIRCGAQNPVFQNALAVASILALFAANRLSEVLLLCVIVQPVMGESDQCPVVSYTVLTECHPLCSAANVTVNHPASQADVVLQRPNGILSRVSISVVAVTNSGPSHKSPRPSSVNVISSLMQKFNKLSSSHDSGVIFEELYWLTRRDVDLLEFRRKNLISVARIIAGATNINVTSIEKVESVYADNVVAVTSAVTPRFAIVGDSSVLLWNLEAGCRYHIILTARQSDGHAVTDFNVQYWTLLKPPSSAPRQLGVVRITSTTIALSNSNEHLKRRSVRSSDDHRIVSDYYVVVDELNDQHRGVFEDLVKSEVANVYDKKIVPLAEPILRSRDDLPSRTYHVEFHLKDWPPQDHLIVGRYQALKPNTYYVIWFAVGSTLDNATQLAWSRINQVLTPPLTTNSISTGGIVAIVLVIILFIIICLFVLGFCCYPVYRKCKKECRSATVNDLIFHFRGLLCFRMDPRPDVKPCKCLVEEPSVDGGCVVVGNVHSDDDDHRRRCLPFDARDTFDHSYHIVKKNRPIAVNQLRRNYEHCLMPNGYYAMQVEFQRIPRCPADSTHVANHPHHSTLNCSPLYLPYDKNRVILTRARLNHKAYINASHIRTLVHQPTVIVTQSPTRQTVGAFWQMIWEKNISSIVMLVPYDDLLSSTYPGYRYWPVRLSQPAVYRNITVELVDERKYSYFERRLLQVSHDDTAADNGMRTRRVVHWQYVRWRSTGSLPLHPLQFIDFVRRVQQQHDTCNGFVVLSEYGSEPSGTFLALDALSTDGRKTGMVDVENCVTLLCLERIGVVHTFLQYRYIHQCILEMFLVQHNTNVPTSYFKVAYVSVGQRNVHAFHSLVEYEYAKLSLPCYAFRNYLHINNNYNFNSTPGYIRVDGHLIRNLFTLPSAELCSSIERILTLVYTLKALAVVVLSPLECPDWLPSTAGHSKHVGKYLLGCNKVRTSATRCFRITDWTIVEPGFDNSPTVTLKLYEFFAWSSVSELPTPSSTLDLLSKLADGSRQDKAHRPVIFYGEPIANHCWRSRVAVVATIWNVLDRIQVDGMVDVFLAARQIGTVIPEAFTTYDQYLFAYKVINEHITRVESCYKGNPALHTEVKRSQRLPRSRNSSSSSICPNDTPCKDVGFQVDQTQSRKRSRPLSANPANVCCKNKMRACRGEKSTNQRKLEKKAGELLHCSKADDAFVDGNNSESSRVCSHIIASPRRKHRTAKIGKKQSMAPSSSEYDSCVSIDPMGEWSKVASSRCSSPCYTLPRVRRHTEKCNRSKRKEHSMIHTSSQSGRCIRADTANQDIGPTRETSRLFVQGRPTHSVKLSPKLDTNTSYAAESLMSMTKPCLFVDDRHCPASMDCQPVLNPHGQRSCSPISWRPVVEPVKPHRDSNTTPTVSQPALEPHLHGSSTLTICQPADEKSESKCIDWKKSRCLPLKHEPDKCDVPSVESSVVVADKSCRGRRRRSSVMKNDGSSERVKVEWFQIANEVRKKIPADTGFCPADDKVSDRANPESAKKATSSEDRQAHQKITEKNANFCDDEDVQSKGATSLRLKFKEDNCIKQDILSVVVGDIPNQDILSVVVGDIPNQDILSVVVGDIPNQDILSVVVGDIPNQDHAVHDLSPSYPHTHNNANKNIYETNILPIKCKSDESKSVDNCRSRFTSSAERTPMLPSSDAESRKSEFPPMKGSNGCASSGRKTKSKSDLKEKVICEGEDDNILQNNASLAFTKLQANVSPLETKPPFSSERIPNSIDRPMLKIASEKEKISWYISPGSSSNTSKSNCSQINSKVELVSSRLAQRCLNYSTTEEKKEMKSLDDRQEEGQGASTVTSLTTNTITSRVVSSSSYSTSSYTKSSVSNKSCSGGALEGNVCERIDADDANSSTPKSQEKQKFKLRECEQKRNLRASYRDFREDETISQLIMPPSLASLHDSNNICAKRVTYPEDGHETDVIAVISPKVYMVKSINSCASDVETKSNSITECADCNATNGCVSLTCTSKNSTVRSDVETKSNSITECADCNATNGCVSLTCTSKNSTVRSDVVQHLSNELLRKLDSCETIERNQPMSCRSLPLTKCNDKENVYCRALPADIRVKNSAMAIAVQPIETAESCVSTASTGSRDVTRDASASKQPVDSRHSYVISPVCSDNVENSTSTLPEGEADELPSFLRDCMRSQKIHEHSAVHSVAPASLTCSSTTPSNVSNVAAKGSSQQTVSRETALPPFLRDFAKSQNGDEYSTLDSVELPSALTTPSNVSNVVTKGSSILNGSVNSEENNSLWNLHATNFKKRSDIAATCTADPQNKKETIHKGNSYTNYANGNEAIIDKESKMEVSGDECSWDVESVKRVLPRAQRVVNSQSSEEDRDSIESLISHIFR